MLWLIPALFGAFFKASSSLFRKKASANLDGSAFLWASSLLSTLILLPFVVENLTAIVNLFRYDLMIMLGVSIPLVFATILNVHALSREDLSFISPLNGFVPIFTLIFAALIASEVPPMLGVAGVFVIFIGTYFLGLKPDKVYWYDPIVLILKNRAAQMSILVAICFAINTSFIKVATDRGYDVLTVLFGAMLLCLVLSSYVLALPRKRNQLADVIALKEKAAIAAVISSLAANYLHMLTISLTFASYAIAARRFDAIFSVLLGWKVLKEKDIKQKLIGSGVIVLGCAILVLSA